MNTIEDVFEGIWKSQTEYLIKCPYCGDHKTHNHCYVNTDKGMFMCHHCGEAGPIERLLQDHGGGEEIERGPGIVEKPRHEEIDVRLFKQVTGMHNTMDRMALTYLKSRGLSKSEIEVYQIRYMDFGRYYGRVIFPVIENNDYVSFIARSFMETVNPKYLFPHHGETKLTTNECMWGWNHAKGFRQDNVILVEGVLDAISVNRKSNRDWGAVALHSKQLGEPQLRKLLRLDRNIRFTVMMDGDAHKDGLKIAKKLRGYGRDVKMSLLNKDEDPDSITSERMTEVLFHRTFRVDVNLAMKVYFGG